ncbi:hypothetical protein F3Y22_tig00110332pilonHSYRG00046 [Hibiscus syriacus]|uniref:Protein kinase domain-containing protein n=1 Tax=Hibiscus syriacus TaxID=106335 RepID=A0A6A3AVT1_HIBSY|nr:pollen receptor-like kinase 3 [Hibiscus syriacus]KAE8708721.1 hypothetical protein F3Y22_tig00110332pilonHSYRG00046 [Hibiscus syriacus]
MPFLHLYMLSFLFLLLPPSTFSIPERELESLLLLKKHFTNAGALSSWMPGSAPCNGRTHWTGLLCYNGVVIGLNLIGMGLSGNIKVEALAEIKGLRSFSVVNNSFQGDIPELNRLVELRALYLSGNQFSGEIQPYYFSEMVSLKKVWLSNNKFTGSIPLSLGQLPHLVELRLENNQFSGHIPAFYRPNLDYINLSNNKLVGDIPFRLSKFNESSFAGNPGLCGKNLGVECAKPVENSTSLKTDPDEAVMKPNKRSSQKYLAAFIVLGMMLITVIILAAIGWMKKKKDTDASVLVPAGRSSGDPIEVRVTVPIVKEVEPNRKSNASSSSSCRGSNNLKARGSSSADLVMVNDEKGVFKLADLMKAAAEVLGNGGLGTCYKVTVTNGVEVVVKKMRDMNALGKDDFDKEVKRLGKLRHPNILTPLAYHYRPGEKLFVYEYLPNGSLLYLLHGDRDSSHVELDWPARLKIVQGISRGLDHLHMELSSLEVPHGNLKSSNVLLSPDNHPFLSDYGYRPLVNTKGTEALFAYKTPEATQGGKVSPKSDVYCLGIIILEILTGKFPAQYLRHDEGGTDVVQWAESALSERRQDELLDPEITEAQNSSLGNMERLLHIGLLCTQTCPGTRLELKTAIKMIEELQVDGGQ